MTANLVFLQRSSRHPDFRHKLTREPLWLNSQFKPEWVDRRLHTLDAPLYNGPGSSYSESVAGPSYVFQSLCEEGQLDKAMDILRILDRHGTIASVFMCRCLLKACGKTKALVHVERLQAYMSEHGLDAVLSLGEYLVSTLLKCDSLELGLMVFYSLPQRTTFSWTALICAYATAGQGRMALSMYDGMQQECVEPDKYTFVSLFKACTILSDIKEGRRIHADALKYGYDTDLFVATSVVDMYAKCGGIVEAQIVFDKLSVRDVVAWNTMLAAYTQVGEEEKTLQLYEQMLAEGTSPDNRTFVSAFQACGMLAEKERGTTMGELPVKLQSLQKGRAIHVNACVKGYDSDAYVGTTLVSMYGKCGAIVDADNVFDRLLRSDVGLWNSMIAAALLHNRVARVMQLYEEMLYECVSPDDRTLVCLLKACCALDEQENVAQMSATRERSLVLGKVLHAESHRRGYDADIFVSSSLITLFGRSGSSDDAQIIFDRLHMPNAVSWTAMLSAYAQEGLADKALMMYEEMQEGGVRPDDRTFVIVLQACGIVAEREEEAFLDGGRVKVRSLQRGKVIHAAAARYGYASDVFVCNTLLGMYGKCGSVQDAKDVFIWLSERTVVSWTGMLVAHCHQSQADKVVQLYGQMREDCASPDDWTFVSMLQGCSMLADKEGAVAVNGDFTKVKSLQMGKAIHADITLRGYGNKLFVGNSLINMYGKSGSLHDAWNVFDNLSDRDVVSWNALLAAYVQQGEVEKTLQLYRQMLQEGTSPNEITSTYVLQACSSTGNLSLCKQIHHRMISTGGSVNALSASSLIHAYGRCASLVDAHAVFDSLMKPDLVAWTTLIAVYARQGYTDASLQCYEDMLRAGIRPDEVTFLSVLSACSHSGVVDKGLDYFASMSRDYGLTPRIEHYVSMIDLLGRAGHLTEVEELLETMPVPPDLAFWLCLMGACQKHGTVELGKRAFDAAVHLEASHSAAYILMSNIYANAGHWDGAYQVEQMREAAFARKREASQCWIEHGQEILTFVMGNSEQEQVHGLLEVIGTREQPTRVPHA